MADHHDQHRSAEIDISNLSRAERAREILACYAKSLGLENDDAQTVISDLLTDITHLCQLNGINYKDCLRRAAMHHRAEASVPADA